MCIEEYSGKIDFAYAFMMVHEVSDKSRLLSELYASLKDGGRLLIAEPYIHVTARDFNDTVVHAKAIGFKKYPTKRKIAICRTAIFKK